MRAEIIRCDTCIKEHDAQYYLPKEWITTKQRDQHDCDIEQHFCSKECLVSWATKDLVPNKQLDHVDECMKMLGISLNLLDPKGSLGGPAGTMEQIMIMETVKDDWTKLSDAILVLRNGDVQE
jgi:hypothetical protein